MMFLILYLLSSLLTFVVNCANQVLLCTAVLGLPVGLVMFKVQEYCLPVRSPVELEVGDHSIIMHLSLLPYYLIVKLCKSSLLTVHYSAWTPSWSCDVQDTRVVFARVTACRTGSGRYSIIMHLSLLSCCLIVKLC